MTSSVSYVYKEGNLDYFMIRTPKSGDIYYAGQVPLYFAVKYAEKILECGNCYVTAFWCGLCIGMCSNCGLETGTQKGFINNGQECENDSHSHLPSVWKSYLSNDWDLKRIGDKNIVNTISIMVDELCEHLFYKFGYEPQPAVHGLADYLRSLDHDPRWAILRINEMRDIPKEELYGRNWAQFDANSFTDVTELSPSPSLALRLAPDCERDNETTITDDYRIRRDDTTHEYYEGPITFASFTKDPPIPPVLTRTDTEYHYGLPYQNDSDEASGETCVVYEDDIVSEISDCDVEECDFSKLTQEQQDEIYKVIDENLARAEAESDYENTIK